MQLFKLELELVLVVGFVVVVGTISKLDFGGLNMLVAHTIHSDYMRKELGMSTSMCISSPPCMYVYELL